MNAIHSIAGLVVPAVLAPLCAAQGPLVDINGLPPTVPADSSPADFVTLGARTLFTADVPGLGRELCVFDGSTMSILADIEPGAASSDPDNLTVAGGYVWFSADRSDTARELWRSDGTTAGTHLVADLLPGSLLRGDPREFVEFAGQVYFSAFTALTPDGYTSGLWRTDGTAAGTTVVSDLAILSTSSNNEFPSELTVAGGLLYFITGYYADGVWRTDGTPAGTFSLNNAGVWNPGDLVELNGSLYFLATQLSASPPTPPKDGLWTSDGVSVQPLVLSSQTYLTNPRDLTPWAGGLYFTAYNATFQRSVFRSDGSPGSLDQLTFPLGTYSPSPGQFAPATSFLAFVNNDAATGYELWKTDGTPAGTTVIQDLVPGPGSPNVAMPTALGDRVVFRADDGGGAGLEPWVTDGSTMQLLADIVPGTESSTAAGFYADGASVWFSADDPSVGREPWRTDGTPVGTALAGDAAVTPGSTGSEPRDFVRLGDRVLFVADDGVHGNEVWYSDGTSAGTGLLYDAIPGPASSNPRDLTVMGDQAFFIVKAVDLIFTDKIEIWKTDGTPAGTGPLTNLFDLGWFNPENLVAVGGRLFFTADDLGPIGREAWSSDGTFGGTVFLGETNPQPIIGDGSGTEFTPVEGGFVFRADGPSFQDQLWFTDGTANSAVALTDGSPSFPYNPWKFVPLGDDRAVFSGVSSGQGAEPHVTDGTTAGTFQLADLEPGFDSPWSMDFVPVGDRVVIIATTDDQGRELWTTDGTVAGTTMLIDFVPGVGSASPYYAGSLGDRAFFVTNALAGPSLWMTDGTPAGTVGIFDTSVLPGINWVSGPFVGAGELFYFGVYTNAGEHELWRTDGTPAGTIALATTPQLNSFGELTAIGSGNEILLLGTDGAGREVWRSRGTPATTEHLLDVELGAANSNPADFYRAGLNVVFTAAEYLSGRELYSLPLAATEASVLETFGVSSPGTGGLAPAVVAGGKAQLGQTVTVGLEDAFGPSTAFLFLSLDRTALPLGGCVQYVADPVVLFGATPTSALGEASISVPIPAGLAALTYLPLYLQYLVADPAGPLAGATLSDALEVVIGPAD